MRWNYVKVSQLPEIQRLIEFNTSDLVELLDRDIALLSIITGKTEDYFNSLNPVDFGKYRVELYELIATTPANEYRPNFKIGGRKFETVVSAKMVTAAQLADLHLLKIDEKNYYSKIPYIMAVFSQEKRGLKFWVKPLTFTRKVELFKDLPADTANSISLFFCKVSPILETRIRNYLESEIENKVNNLMKTLSDLRHGQGGDGSKQSTNSRTGTSPKRKRT